MQREVHAVIEVGVIGLIVHPITEAERQLLEEK